MRYLKALAAAIVLAALVVGVPLGLILGYGNPTKGFTEGLVTDTTILDVLVVVCWALWAQMTLCFAIEAINQIRAHRGTATAWTLPAPGPQADLTRFLIGAVLAVGVLGTTTFTAGRANAAIPATSSPTTSISTAAQPAPADQQHPEIERSLEIVVQPGDSLWKLAEVHLGNGAQWRRIADLNHGRQLGGVIATTAILQDGLQPGWRLLVPTPPSNGHHVVEPGESLSEIAEEDTGNAANWPQLYTANHTIIGDNPNLIQPGQDLTIPNGATSPLDTHTPQDTAESAPRTTSVRLTALEALIHAAAKTQANGDHLAATPRHLEPDHAASASQMQSVAPWLIGSLLFTGGVLAGHLHLRLRARRRDRSRARRPGRSIAPPTPEFTPLERTITTIGAPTAEALDFLDLQLRRLGHTTPGAGVPRVIAVDLTETHATLNLAEPAALAAPWRPHDADGLRWTCPIEPTRVDEERWDLPAPYPLLTTIGHDQADRWWLLNLEEIGTLAISGDTEKSTDLMRYIAAELAVANWARDARIDLIGIGTELDGIDPKLHTHPEDHDQSLNQALGHALQMVDRSRDSETNTTSGRAHQPDEETWPARLILNTADTDQVTRLSAIIDLVGSQPGKTATAVVTTTPATSHDETTKTTEHSALEVAIDSDGTLRIERVGLTLTACQLPAIDARGITDLYRQASELVETTMPVADDATQEWEGYVDVTGNLREEHTLDRSDAADGDDTSTLLIGQDQDYADHAAVVDDDLEVLSPYVPASVSTAIRDADPHLEDDLADWIGQSNRRPRLRLLGEVKAVGYGPNVAEISERFPFYTELLAFLWTHARQGATTEEVLSAFPTLAASRIRIDLGKLREWIGVNADTGELLLPAAKQAPARAHHGRNVYQVDCGPGGLLVDVDLLRRLRVRAQATGGPEGIALLTTALAELVDGQPFNHLRNGGWSWMLEGDRLDEHMVVAISDMAHIATSHYLTAGDIANARTTADIGLLAAPYEETMRLDMVAVREAEGASAAAAKLLDRAVLNRSDDGLAPRELSDRTRRILKNRGWSDQCLNRAVRSE